MTKQGSSPTVGGGIPWQREFQSSLNESDPKKLLERVHATETAIFFRLQELSQGTVEDTAHGVERQAIAEALRTLRRLKRDRLGFPDWEAT